MSLEQGNRPNVIPPSAIEAKPPYFTAESLDQFVELAREKGATAISGGVVFLRDEQPEEKTGVKFETALRAIAPSGRDVYFREEHPERIDRDVFTAKHPNPLTRRLQLRKRRDFVANALIVHAYGELKAVAEKMPGVETMLFSGGRRITQEELQSPRRWPQMLDLAVTA